MRSRGVGTALLAHPMCRPALPRLQLVTPGWSLLVSSDVKWQGWRAYVDKTRQPPVTVNGAFLGAFVPPGTHVVEFRYRPAAFDTGLRVSAAALLLIAIGAFVRKIW